MRVYVRGRFISSGVLAATSAVDGTVAVPNGDHVAPYAQFNAGIAHEFSPGGGLKPITVRFDVVNVFDTIYQVRNGTGIGVFAPQYGPRRRYFVGISEKL